MTKERYDILVKMITNVGINEITAKAFVNVMEMHDINDITHLPDDTFRITDPSTNDTFVLVNDYELSVMDNTGEYTRISLPVYSS